MTSNRYPQINLGCGIYPEAGFVNVDVDPSVHPDIVRDVTRGLPFGDASVALVRAHHFLEHLDPDDFLFVISECWRVLVPGGLLDVLVPLGITDDPTHRIFFHENSFNVFLDPNAQAYYRRGTTWSCHSRSVVAQKFPGLHIVLCKQPPSA